MGWPRTTSSFPEPTWWNGDEPDPNPFDEPPIDEAEREAEERHECWWESVLQQAAPTPFAENK